MIDSRYSYAHRRVKTSVGFIFIRSNRLLFSSGKLEDFSDWRIDMTNEQKEKIIESRERGYGYSSIASALGLTKNQVSAFCHRSGLAGEKATQAITDKPDFSCCKNCGKPIVQIHGRKQVKFCSDECCQNWWNAHPEAVNRKAVYSFTCACCGKPFTAYGNRGRKYCSHACYIAERFGGGHHE